MPSKPWIRLYEEGVPAEVEIPQATLPELLASTAARHARRPALSFFGRALTYAQLDELVTRFAATLQGLGVAKGDRVMLLLPNTPQFVIGYYGALRAGAIVVPTNPQYVARELEHQAADSGAETIVSLTLFWERVRQALPSTSLRQVVLTNIKEYFPPLLRLLFTVAKERKEGHRARLGTEDRVHWWQDLLASAEPAGFQPPAIAPEDVAILGYTGGTTGVPKGAMLSHRNLVANAIQTRHWFPRLAEGREIILGALPFFHSYGMTVVMNLAVTIGARMVLIPNPREFDRVMQAIHKQKPSLFPGVPTMYVALNNHPALQRYDVSSIKYCISGAAPLPAEVQETFESLTGARLVEGYGLTEASPVTHVNPLEGQRKAGTIGLPLPSTECQIVDLETDDPVPPGTPGELCVSGPQVMLGYWQKPEETAGQLRDGWLHTGDVATMDEEGYFAIVDRKKDMVLVAGYNVYPREVEDVLYEHDKVLEAAVVGVADPYRGETVKAFVVLKPGSQAGAEELIEFCRARLAPYKVPREVEFRQELPKTLVGKVLRRVLAKEEEARLAREGAG